MEHTIRKKILTNDLRVWWKERDYKSKEGLKIAANIKEQDIKELRNRLGLGAAGEGNSIQDLILGVHHMIIRRLLNNAYW